MKVLNVAEKPDAAKRIAIILSNGKQNYRQGPSRYNPIYEFQFRLMNQDVTMVVTSVAGHLMSIDFDKRFSSWTTTDPLVLFDLQTPVVKFVSDKMQMLEKQIKDEARNCQKLVLWLDCDREGENIGFEVVDVCRKGNPYLSVNNGTILRARFSELTQSAVFRAINNLVKPNELDSMAVEARKEIDLRIGAAFTRFQTQRLKNKFIELEDKDKISYGPCQFPTLGFVVDRYIKQQSFVSEKFWGIHVTHTKNNAKAEFTWKRGRLYDRLSCLVIYEMSVEQPQATVLDICKQERRKYRPFPLNTVELQKLSARKLRLGSSETMEIAEKLYNNGLISYPRTETNQYTLSDDELQKLIQIQTSDTRWGAYAQTLLDGKYVRPKNGKSDDKAHPPIHPIKHPEGVHLTTQEQNVYQLITRHYLACCSGDAIAFETVIMIDIRGERFTCKGLMISQENYLEVYKPYESWTDKNIPLYEKGETFIPTSMLMKEGQTQPPSLLSESELIGLMDKNGIGTDATIAQHITTIQERGYAVKQAGLFKPTDLGLALVQAYDQMGYPLSKPNLRRKMEEEMNGISRGLTTKDTVLIQNLAMYKDIFIQVVKKAKIIDNVMRKHFNEIGTLGSSVVDAKNFTKCGKCNNMMHLKHQGNNRFLFCPSCKRSHNLPFKGNFSPHTFSCPICQYQVVQVTNTQTNSSHYICPFCFSNPPDIENAPTATFSSGFRCFQCSKSGCPLASSQAESILGKCRSCSKSDMILKTTRTEKVMISCSNRESCGSVIWLPQAEKIEVASENCPNCLQNGPVKMLRFKFKPNKVPAHIQLDANRCVFCDNDLQEFIRFTQSTVSSSTSYKPYGRGRASQSKYQSNARTRPTR